MSVGMTDSNERKLTGGGSPNSRASDTGFVSKSSTGLRKAHYGNADSGASAIGVQSSNKGGNNVPWGKVNDRTKMSSKMFQMTAKVESTKFYTQEKQMLNKDITSQIIREQASRRNRNSFNVHTSPQKRATLQNLYQIQENANLEL
jgi:predicted DNA-binding protein (MmcQ/YjbR family)